MLDLALNEINLYNIFYKEGVFEIYVRVFKENLKNSKNNILKSFIFIILLLQNCCYFVLSKCTITCINHCMHLIFNLKRLAIFQNNVTYEKILARV